MLLLVRAASTCKQWPNDAGCHRGSVSQLAAPVDGAAHSGGHNVQSIHSALELEENFAWLGGSQVGNHQLFKQHQLRWPQAVLPVQQRHQLCKTVEYRVARSNCHSLNSRGHDRIPWRRWDDRHTVHSADLTRSRR